MAHSYLFSIAVNEFGGSSWTFEVNPLDAEGLFPRRPLNSIRVIDGADMLQFPEEDTVQRSFRFDTMSGSRAANESFLFGDSDADTDSLQYLKSVDANGQLTTYWLNIPDSSLRPSGYRNYAWIPIRVEDVLTVPSRDRQYIKWDAEMFFTVLPRHQATYTFTVGISPLGGQNTLITSQITKVYFYDANLASYTDYTDEAYAGGSPFPVATIAQGDQLLLGCDYTFYGANFEMDTPETVEPDPEQGGVAHTQTAWNGSTWVSVSNNDHTYSFTQDGQINWGTITGWTADNLSEILGAAPSTDDLYWVIITIGTVTTPFDFNKILRA